jgi:hypothetical protein
MSTDTPSVTDIQIPDLLTAVAGMKAERVPGLGAPRLRVRRRPGDRAFDRPLHQLHGAVTEEVAQALLWGTGAVFILAGCYLMAMIWLG